MTKTQRGKDENQVRIRVPRKKIKNDKKEEGETLVVTLKDVKEEIYLELYYTIFRDLNVLVRFSRIINKTNNNIKINRISSFELDTPNDDYEVVSLHGQWAQDREIETQKVTHSNLIVDYIH